VINEFCPNFILIRGTTNYFVMVKILG
jgi:hypothetical protein